MRRALALGAGLALACQSPPSTQVTRCIADLPAPPSMAQAASLAVTPTVLWAKPITRAITGEHLALAGDRLIVSAGATVLFLDRNGERIASRASTAFDGMSSPVVDEAGTVYTAGASAYAIDAAGEFRWVTPFPAGVSGRPFVLGPHGLVYTGATDGALWAFETATGRVAWRREIGVNPGNAPPRVAAGAGNAVLAVTRGAPGQLFDALDGTPLAPTPEAELYGLMFGNQIGLVARRMEDSPGVYPRMTIAALDGCSRTTWSIAPSRPQWPALLATGDRLLVVERDDVERSPTFLAVYGPDGARLAGPSPAPPPWVVGADGTVIGLFCDGSGYDGPSRLVGLSIDGAIGELWRVELGEACPKTGPVLAADGVLYFTWLRGDVTELVAVQTTSPGLASSSWPVAKHDNRGTSWLR
jgi:outer membrane protein assembly factor BamB